MGKIVIAERNPVFLCPVAQPLDVEADKLAAVLVVGDETMVALDVLVQPDRIGVVAAQIPKRIDEIARV